MRHPRCSPLKIMSTFRYLFGNPARLAGGGSLNYAPRQAPEPFARYREVRRRRTGRRSTRARRHTAPLPRSPRDRPRDHPRRREDGVVQRPRNTHAAQPRRLAGRATAPRGALRVRNALRWLPRLGTDVACGLGLANDHHQQVVRTANGTAGHAAAAAADWAMARPCATFAATVAAMPRPSSHRASAGTCPRADGARRPHSARRKASKKANPATRHKEAFLITGDQIAAVTSGWAP